MRRRLYRTETKPNADVPINEDVNAQGETNEEKPELNDSTVKQIKPFRFRDIIRKIVDNPEFSYQIMVIILILASENFKMDRGINDMTSGIEKIRSITDIITQTMQSVKVAADAPKQIRRLLQ